MYRQILLLFIFLRPESTAGKVKVELNKEYRANLRKALPGNEDERIRESFAAAINNKSVNTEKKL